MYPMYRIILHYDIPTSGKIIMIWVSPIRTGFKNKFEVFGGKPP
jgi:hypothetical protein